MPAFSSNSYFLFFNDTATTEIYTLSLHDALPISTEDEDPFILVLAHLVRARVLLRAGSLDRAAAEVVAAEARSMAISQAWWMAALARTRAAVTASASGWAASAPQWRQGLAEALGPRAVGEVAT